LFRDIDSAITLAFLTRSPSQDKLDWLSPTRWASWLRSVHYPNPDNADQLWNHLQQAARGTTGPQAAPQAPLTAALVATLTAIRTQIHEVVTRSTGWHGDACLQTQFDTTGVLPYYA
jgi:hypothetical protein